MSLSNNLNSFLVPLRDLIDTSPTAKVSPANWIVSAVSTVVVIDESALSTIPPVFLLCKTPPDKTNCPAPLVPSLLDTFSYEPVKAEIRITSLLLALEASVTEVPFVAV